jgi:hypothetical protein
MSYKFWENGCRNSWSSIHVWRISLTSLCCQLLGSPLPHQHLLLCLLQGSSLCCSLQADVIART